MRILFASLVLLLGALAAEAALTTRPPVSVAAPIPPEASLDANVLRVILPEALAASVDPSRLRLVVYEGEPRTPLLVEDFLETNGTLRLVFLEGAGSGDAARLVDEDGTAAINVTVDVRTPADVLPGPRWGATFVDDGAGTAYVFGGAVTPAAIRGQPMGDWMALDAILRVDLGTGNVSTRAARLPSGLVVAAGAWDPRPSEACPAGCAYVFGGLESPSRPVGRILRYDPVSDVITELPVALPMPRFDFTAVWSGTHAYLIGGGFSVLRFDPLTMEIDPLRSSPFAYVFGAGAVFDARPTATCPAGCAYVFGGREVVDPLPPFSTVAMERDVILRLDVAAETLVPLPARLPLRLEAVGAAWDGERAYVAGGRACSPDACVRSDAAFVFDPATLAVSTLPPLPVALENAPAAWHAGEIILVGGKADDAPAGSLDRIVRLRPEGRP